MALNVACSKSCYRQTDGEIGRKCVDEHSLYLVYEVLGMKEKEKPISEEVIIE